MTLICTSELDVGRVAGVGADWLRESPSGASLPAERRKAHARRADNKVMIGMAVTSPWSVAYLIGHHSDRYLRPGHCLSSYRIAYCQRPIGVVKWEGGGGDFVALRRMHLVRLFIMFIRGLWVVSFTYVRQEKGSGGTGR